MKYRKKLLKCFRVVKVDKNGKERTIWPSQQRKAEPATTVVIPPSLDLLKSDVSDSKPGTWERIDDLRKYYEHETDGVSAFKEKK